MDLNNTTAIAHSLKYAAGVRRCSASLWPVLACACGRSPPQGFLQLVLSTARCQQQPDSPGATFAVPLKAGACAVADDPPCDHRSPTFYRHRALAREKRYNGGRGVCRGGYVIHSRWRHPDPAHECNGGSRAAGDRMAVAGSVAAPVSNDKASEVAEVADV